MVACIAIAAWMQSASAGSLTTYDAIYPSLPFTTGQSGGQLAGGFAGDLDGDGTSEVWVGVATASVWGNFEGMFELFRGGPQGGASWLQIIGRNRETFGCGASVSDINRDGVADLLISGGICYDEAFYQAQLPSALYVFFGPLPSGVMRSTDADVIVEQVGPGSARFGPVVPDLTGDGQPDMVALTDLVRWTTGELVTLDLALIAAQPPGTYAIDLFETARVSFTDYQSQIRALGDQDNDGLEEIGIVQGNRLWIVPGAALLGGSSPITDVAPRLIDIAYGADLVAPVADLNLDGDTDFITGGFMQDAIGLYFTALWMVDGSDVMALPPGADVPIDQVADRRSLPYDAWLGDAAPLGDVNGDSLPDVAIGATSFVSQGGYRLGETPGGLWIVAGDGDLTVTGATRPLVHSMFTAVRFPYNVGAFLGVGQDCDGDGLPDLLVGANMRQTPRAVALCY